MDLPIKNGDLPIKNGDLPIKNGDVASKISVFWKNRYVSLPGGIPQNKGYQLLEWDKPPSRETLNPTSITITGIFYQLSFWGVNMVNMVNPMPKKYHVGMVGIPPIYRVKMRWFIIVSHWEQ